MELLTYFNSEHTPADEFGEIFFEDWDGDAWGKFYNFMLGCVRSWFASGKKITVYDSETTELKRLICQTSREFVEFMESQPLETQLSMPDLYQEFTEVNGFSEKEKRNFGSRKFGRYIGKWGKFKGYKIERIVRKKNGKSIRGIIISDGEGIISEEKQISCVHCRNYNEKYRTCLWNGNGGYIISWEKCQGKHYESLEN
jgi:hypothetical protein